MTASKRQKGAIARAAPAFAGPAERKSATVDVENDRPEVKVNTIVYATDFYSCSENAGDYAWLLAEYFSAALLVTHAFLLTQAAMEVEQGLHKRSRQREELEVRLRQKSDSLTKGSVSAVPVLLEGNPNEVIPKLADNHAPSMLVLGTHGGSRLEHEVMGSVAEKILRSTRWPCLTIGPQTPRINDKTRLFRRILYATDLTPATTHAAMFALSFSEQAGGTLDVLNVVPEIAEEDPAGWEQLRKQHVEELERLVPRQAREFSSPNTYVESGRAHQRIMRHLEEDSIDLLVLGIRRAPFLSLEMRTSGAFRIIANAPCPVLTIMG